MSYLNNLEKRLNNLLPSQKIKNKNLKSTKYRRLSAIFLNEYIQSGAVFDESTFKCNGVYAEFSKQGLMKFHIYPIIEKIAKPREHETKTENKYKKITIEARIK